VLAQSGWFYKGYDMAVIIDGLNGITTPTGTGDVSVGDDLIFTGTGNRITGDFSNATVANRVLFQSSTTNGITAVTAIPNGTATDARFTVNNNSDPTNSNGIQILANATEARVQATNFGTAPAFPMTFYTGGSERVRIDTSGNVGIGTSSPGSRLDVVAQDAIRITGFQAFQTWRDNNDSNKGFRIQTAGGNTLFSNDNTGGGTYTERARIDSAGALLVNTTTATGTVNFSVAADTTTKNPMSVVNTRTTAATDFSIIFYRAGNIVGSVQTSLTATSFVTSSDYRLKESIAPMTGALEKVQALNPVTYTWKADGSAGQGFIAHELQSVVPDAVTGEKDAVDADGNPQYQGVDTSFLVATLTAAIQEQQAIITDLKARIEVLEQA
jgi:hypothetical protein